MDELLETRIAFLKKKLEPKMVNVPEDVILFIALRIKTGVGVCELEEALIHVVVYSILVNKPITLVLAQKALKSSTYFVSVKYCSEKKVVIDTSKQANTYKRYGSNLN
jgi:chromosomal replication initiation ATPase DnaA